MSKRIRFPPLSRLQIPEAQCIANLFRIYDYSSTGIIPNYLALKLIRTLGLTVPEAALPAALSLTDLLVIVDQIMPEPEPILVGSLESFNKLVAISGTKLLKEEAASVTTLNKPSSSSAATATQTNIQPDEEYMTDQCISEFLESIGRSALTGNEAKLLLGGMLNYDDCTENPAVNIDKFNKELVTFAKKSNAFKDYRM